MQKLNKIYRRCSGEQSKRIIRHEPFNTLARSLSWAAVILLSGCAAYAADQTLAPAPKMTLAEAAETILPDGAIVRITDGATGEMRVGNGITLGGSRIGDGTGWAEGSALTQDLYTDGHKINLGDGWELLTLGGWGALSGPAEITDANGKFRLSVYGNTMLEITSEQAAVQISSFAWVAPNMELTTAIGEVKPTIMYTTNLITGTWGEAPLAGIVTNASTYVFKVNPTNFGVYAYFRATIPSGSGSVANFTATIKQNGIAVATTTDVAIVEGRVDSLEEYTNTAAVAYTTATNNAALIAAMPTNHVTSVVINGVTNTPVAGRVDLGTVSGGIASTARRLVRAGGTSTMTLYDGGLPVISTRHTGGGSAYTSYDVGAGWTNVVFRFHIGSTDQTNAAFRLQIYHREPSGTPNVWKTLSLIGTSGAGSYYCQTGVIYSVSLNTTNCTDYSSLSFWTTAPTEGGASPTNYIWLLDAVVR